jgi:predicted branched-subunit amino acid permease
LGALNSSSRSAEFLSGIKTLLPILAGVFPTAVIIGAAAAGADIPVDVTIAMSVLVFAGPAQLVAAQLSGVGAPAVVILLASVIVNLRLFVYGASLAPHVQHLPARWKVSIAYLITNPTYAVGITRFNQNDDAPNKHWFYFGAGCALWIAWQIGIAIGVALRLQVPPGWSLDFILPLTLIALIIPTLRDRALLTAALSGGLAAVLLAGLPYQLGILCAAAVGMLAGLAVELKNFRSR